MDFISCKLGLIEFELILRYIFYVILIEKQRGTKPKAKKQLKSIRSLDNLSDADNRPSEEKVELMNEIPFFDGKSFLVNNQSHKDVEEFLLKDYLTSKEFLSSKVDLGR